MYVDAYYHKQSMFAYIVLPGIETVEALALELNLIKVHLKIMVPMVFVLRKLAEGPKWGHHLITFKLHPSIPFEQGWPEMTKEIAETLKIEPFKLYEQ